MSGRATVAIRSHTWSVGLATADVELQIGLSGLVSLPAGTGMLFLPEAGGILQVSTGAMRFSIDVVWLDGNGVVTDVALGMAPGYVATPSNSASSFLEVPAGEAADVVVGDQATVSQMMRAGLRAAPPSGQNPLAVTLVNETQGRVDSYVVTPGDGGDAVSIAMPGDNPGTLKGGAAWRVTESGENGLALNGTNAYVELTSRPTGNAPFSFSALGRLKNGPTNHHQQVLWDGLAQMRVNSTGERGVFCAFLHQAGSGVGVGWEPRASGITVPQAGVWYRVTMTWDGTTLSLYVDGLLEGTAVRQVTIGPAVGDVTRWVGAGLGQNWLDGDLKDLRFYNRALSAEEVAALPDSYAGLVHHWRMSDGEGTVVTDQAQTHVAHTYQADGGFSATLTATGPSGTDLASATVQTGFMTVVSAVTTGMIPFIVLSWLLGPLAQMAAAK